uniref:Uncharacterized protein n=1 Tax=Oryza sativa subsp. japonica TaxID=39947 RepID=Q6Z3Z8_ORYSJ|nr:hypothetical protein [Oryza sativa Japonica Group]
MICAEKENGKTPRRIRARRRRQPRRTSCQLLRFGIRVLILEGRARPGGHILEAMSEYLHLFPADSSMPRGSESSVRISITREKSRARCSDELQKRRRRLRLYSTVAHRRWWPAAVARSDTNGYQLVPIDLLGTNKYQIWHR